MTGFQGIRQVADTEDGFVVYINGMRLNKLRAVGTWLRAGRKMAKMLEQLEADPDSGFLGYQPAFMGLRNGAAIQYWRSLEDLQQFARDPEGPHVPAWTWLNEAIGSDGGVGFWAELYVVPEENYETFYRDMPPVGLGEAVGLVPAAAHERRLGLSVEGAAPSADDAAP